MSKHIPLLLLILLTCFTVTLAQTDTPLKPIIIDTDMAADDWLAILYLLQRSDVEVLAITVTGAGEAHCDPGVQNAMNLLELAGNPDIPVACGRETPIQGDHVFPMEWRDGMDAMLGLTLPTNPNPLSELNAVELLTQQLNATEANVTIVTLGPLTNIAEFVQTDSAPIDKIERIFIMGGAVSVAGNLYTDNTTAEWNIYVDPLAVSVVFESGAAITLVALDATNHAPITHDFYNRLGDDRTTPEADFVYQVLTAQIDGINGGWLYFWDPLAAVIATENSIVSVQGRPLIVVTDEGVESGRTMPDDSGTRIDVAANPDAAAFEMIFLNVLNGRDPAAEPTAQMSVASGGETNAVVVERYFEEVWGEQNWETRDELLDTAYLIHTNSDRFTGSRDTLQNTVTTVHTFMPNVRIVVEEIIVVGDTAAARVVLRGRQTGDLYGLLPTNNPIVISINSILHLSNGRIIEEWQTFDLFSLLTSIDAIPEDLLAALSGGGS
jgi:inosine-uridine nucleoside N-ribohydrolase/predicted ester cyclase